LEAPRHILDEQSGSKVDPVVRGRLEQRRTVIKDWFLEVKQVWCMKNEGFFG